jgi:segregation and condensation protein B
MKPDSKKRSTRKEPKTMEATPSSSEPDLVPSGIAATGAAQVGASQSIPSNLGEEGAPEVPPLPSDQQAGAGVLQGEPEATADAAAPSGVAEFSYRPNRGTAAADLDPVRVVEAALFSAGKPLEEVEIAENTHFAPTVVRDALKALAKEYDERGGALEVGKAGAKWAMQVKAAYAPTTARLAPMEIPHKTLKTLALVAYHQPLLQSDLVDMVGDKAYEHVRELVERGLVKKRLSERSFLLSTTELFPEYFGIPATDREQIRQFLAAKVGIPPEVLARAKPKAPLPQEDPLPSSPAVDSAGESTAVPSEQGPAREDEGRVAPADEKEADHEPRAVGDLSFLHDDRRPNGAPSP